jgi:hypothetical protein
MLPPLLKGWLIGGSSFILLMSVLAVTVSLAGVSSSGAPRLSHGSAKEVSSADRPLHISSRLPLAAVDIFSERGSAIRKHLRLKGGMRNAGSSPRRAKRQNSDSEEGDDDEDDDEEEEEEVREDLSMEGEMEDELSSPDGKGVVNQTIRVPVILDNAPMRRSVREVDEWLKLFNSMKGYVPHVDTEYVKELLLRVGANCVDKRTLYFMAYLADCYLYKLLDYTTDWVGVRLEGKLEENDPNENRNKGPEVDRYMRKFNFSVNEVDVLHVSA